MSTKAKIEGRYAERRVLYDEGLTDGEIAERTGFRRGTIGEWRRNSGLPLNDPGRYRLDKEEDNRRRELHEGGLSDTEIGRRVGVGRSSIVGWRQSRGLPANFIRGRKSSLSDDEKVIIKMLHSQDMTIMEISRTVERGYPTVLNYCKLEGLDTSVDRYLKIRFGGGYSAKGERLLRYLDEHGPIGREELIGRGFGVKFLYQVAMVLFDEVERIDLYPGSSGKPLSGYQVYGADYSGPKTYYSTRGDERIINVLSEAVVFRPVDKLSARRLFSFLQRVVDRDRARKVIEKLGYEYSAIYKKRGYH